MRTPTFILVQLVIGAALYLWCSAYVGNDYLFFAGYTVLQYIVLATAWNILGGYCGYVNFGSAGFFAIGVYTADLSVQRRPAGRRPRARIPRLASCTRSFRCRCPFLVVIGGVVAGLVGLGTGYLTLRLRGVFFAIATLALAVVLQTLIVQLGISSAARAAPTSFRRKRFRFSAPISSTCSC